MKPKHIYQVIPLSITTTPVKEVIKEIDDKKSGASWIDKFMEACWNCFLRRVFFRLVTITSTKDPDTFVWEMYADKSSLYGDLTDIPSRIKSMPYTESQLFMSVLTLN